MPTANPRSIARLLAIVAIIAVVWLSAGVTALMQNSATPANRRPVGTQIVPPNAAPVPNVPNAQVLVDGGFEGGTPWSNWTVQTSTNFGSSICDTGICSINGGVTAPQSGTNWLWYGGGTGGMVEDSSTGQSVIIPNTGSAALVLFLKIQQVNTPFTDTLAVLVDGITQQVFTEPATAETAYTKRIVNVSAFANGASHSVVLVYHSIDGTSNFLVDNLFLTAPSAADAEVQGRITDANGAPLPGTVVNLSGTQNRKFITDANGNYRFDNVETNGFYTVRPSRANYSFSPAEQSFSQVGNSTEATFTATAASGFDNPLDTPEFFVRQHYLDFLGGREPDESGFNFWSNQMLECGSDAGCLESRRINISGAFVRSIEFLNTGGLVDGLYRISYGRAPRYAEFIPDQQEVARGVVVGVPNWTHQLTANKQAFVSGWVERAAFRGEYDGLTNDAFVDRLISRTGVDFGQSEREALVSGLAGNTLTRADVLLRIAEDSRFESAKRNESFVMMEYFGFLRRDPDESGLAFWLEKLNRFGGNFEQAEMVKAFLVSGEYRNRFVR
jgi:hypothetical protein